MSKSKAKIVSVTIDGAAALKKERRSLMRYRYQHHPSMPPRPSLLGATCSNYLEYPQHFPEKTHTFSRNVLWPTNANSFVHSRVDRVTCIDEHPHKSHSWNKVPRSTDWTFTVFSRNDSGRTTYFRRMAMLGIARLSCAVRPN